jgi:hypothetical protein
MTKRKPPPEDGQQRAPGFPPERLKIDRSWEDAVRAALKKPKPPEGWPKPDTRRSARD